MSEPKTELVLKRWRTCPNCGYRWLSESKAKDRMSCSKCKTSIMIHPKFTKRRTVIVENEVTEQPQQPPKPKLVKSVKEMQMIVDPVRASINKKMIEAHSRLELNHEKATSKLLDKHPELVEVDEQARIAARQQSEEILSRAKKLRLTQAETMLYYLDETLKTFKKEAPLTGWSQETIKALETVYSKQREHVKYAVAMERAEQKAAAKSDRKYFKDQNKDKTKKQKKIRRSSH